MRRCAESATGLTTQRREAKNPRKLEISFPFFFFVDEIRKKDRKRHENDKKWCGMVCVWAYVWACVWVEKRHLGGEM